MATAPHPHPQRYNSWETRRGHKRLHPDPGLEAYLSPQTNAKEKADAGWAGLGLAGLGVRGFEGFLAGGLIGKTKGLSIHCAHKTGVLSNSELGLRPF